MGRLLKRIQNVKVKKVKVSFTLSEQLIEKMEELRESIGYQNKSAFVEKLLEYALEELERELKRSKTVPKKEEKQEDLTSPKMVAKFSNDGYYAK